MSMVNQIFSFFIILTTCWLTFFNEKINIKDHPIINESFSLFIIASCFLVFFNKKRTFKERPLILPVLLLPAFDQYFKFFISERTNKFSDNLLIFVLVHYLSLFLFIIAHFRKDKKLKENEINTVRNALNDYYFWGPIFLLIVQLVLYAPKFQWALISFAIWAVYSLLFSLFKKESITNK